MKEVAEHLLPELKESEDDRIRKALIEAFSRPPGHNCVNVFNGIPHRKIVTWLEKKGEQNLAFIEKGKWYICIRTSYKPNGKDFIEGKTYYAKEDYKIIGECGEVDIATDNPEEFFRSATEEETNDIIKNFVNEQKPVEWSIEDATTLNELIDFLENGTVKLQHDLTLYANWLKSLKPHNTWKPSDEQMLVMEYIKNCFDFSKPSYREIFISVYKQLKAL